MTCLIFQLILKGEEVARGGSGCSYACFDSVVIFGL